MDLALERERASLLPHICPLETDAFDLSGAGPSEASLELRVGSDRRLASPCRADVAPATSHDPLVRDEIERVERVARTAVITVRGGDDLTTAEGVPL